MNSKKEIVFLGLGSNLGDRENYLKKAIESLEDHSEVEIIKISSLYQSAAQGVEAQPDFFNAVVQIKTTLSPEDFLIFCQKLEKDAGRHQNSHNQPRPLDIDLLFYGQQVINSDSLIVPHPLLSERLFVLIPLEEIAPNWKHPIYNQTISEIRILCKNSKPVFKIPDISLT